jgi:hypothetical protein
MVRQNITRRTTALWVVFLPFIAATAKAQFSEMAEVELRLDTEVFQGIPRNARQKLNAHQDTSAYAEEMIRAVPSQKAVPVILIAVGMLSIPIIWSSIQEMLREYYYGGVLIDTRKNPPSITNSKRIPNDMIFIIDSNGITVKYNSNEFTQSVLTRFLPRR